LVSYEAVLAAFLAAFFAFFSALRCSRLLNFSSFFALVSFHLGESLPLLDFGLSTFFPLFNLSF
jgi:hypothetical protein